MFQLFGQPRLCPPGSQASAMQLHRTALQAILPVLRSVPYHGYEQVAPFVCNSDPRGRTKWYGVYTEEQYLAQRQSEERARWAASVRTITGSQSQVSWEGSLLDPPALLGGVTVVIISPRKPVTVGTVARACGSFECEDLRIVMPRQESYITRRHAKSASKGAQYILYRAGHYDSIEEATADCDVRIAFTRWAQASSPHVYKVDINGLASHAAVQRVIRQPLQSRDAVAAAAAAAPRPPSAAWSEAAAAAAAAAEARLAAGEASAASVTAIDDSSSGEEDEGSPHVLQRGRQPQQPPLTKQGSCGAASGATNSPARHTPVMLEGHRDNIELSETSSQTAHDALPPQTRDHASSGSGGDIREPPDGGPTGRPPRVALVFGREELGMSDEEVDSCEVCCSIPIGRLQESLSLSHAVSIALCALYQARVQHLAIAGSSIEGQQQRQPQLPLQEATTVEAPPGLAGGEGAPRLQYTLDASTGAVHTVPAAAATGQPAAAL